MKTEVSNLVNYTAKRILDGFIQGKTRIELDAYFDAKDIFKDMGDNGTKKIIMENLKDFNDSLNDLIWSRMEYLMVEGFLICEDVNIRMKTETEIEQFVNAEDEE